METIINPQTQNIKKHQTHLMHVFNSGLQGESPDPSTPPSHVPTWNLTHIILQHITSLPDTPQCQVTISCLHKQPMGSFYWCTVSKMTWRQYDRKSINHHSSINHYSISPQGSIQHFWFWFSFWNDWHCFWLQRRRQMKICSFCFQISVRKNLHGASLLTRDLTYFHT